MSPRFRVSHATRQQIAAPTTAATQGGAGVNRRFYLPDWRIWAGPVEAAIAANDASELLDAVTATAEAEPVTPTATGPKTAREAIERGTAALQAGKPEESIALFQKALELPGSGSMRFAGTVREYRCASEGEENAALYNMACAYAQMQRQDSALTCLQAALENDFSDFSSIRGDPDLAPVRGPALEKLLGKYDNVFAKVFKKKKSTNRPWLLW